MKRFLVLIPVCVCIVFAACKKVSGPANGNSVQVNNNLDSTVSFSASINSTTPNWTTDSAYGYFIKSAGNDSLLRPLLITASKNVYKGTYSSFKLNITNYTGPKTYNIDPPGNSISYNEGNTQFFATYGSITITSDTPYAMIGTFSFGADSMQVKGSFNVATP